MSSIAFVDHSFHKKTQSNLFLTDLLRDHGHTVDFFWDDGWQGGAKIRICDLASYDAIVLFQCDVARDAYYYRQCHRNVTCVPMLDEAAISAGPGKEFCARLWPMRGSKLLAFSSALHALATTAGIHSKHAQYYCPPLIPQPAHQEGMRGFFWQRRPDMVSWGTVKTLLGQCRFDSLHLHLAEDPGQTQYVPPTEEECRFYNISISHWFDCKADYERVRSAANVFFAPRTDEGIGLSFLECFSAGQCVVAPDYGTMNEYIIHGLNGLLYEPKTPRPLDFSAVATLGSNAYQSCVSGHMRWRMMGKELVEYILTPSDAWYTHGFKPNLKEIACLGEMGPNLKGIVRGVARSFLWNARRYGRPLMKRLGFGPRH